MSFVSQDVCYQWLKRLAKGKRRTGGLYLFYRKTFKLPHQLPSLLYCDGWMCVGTMKSYLNGWRFHVCSRCRLPCLLSWSCPIPKMSGRTRGWCWTWGYTFPATTSKYIAMGKLQMSICKVLSIIKLSASPLQWSTTCWKYAAFASPVLSWPGPIVARFGARRWFKLLLCLVPGGGELTEEPRWRRSLEKVPPDPEMSIH